MTLALQPRGITRRFPGVLANNHVKFSLERGESHAEIALCKQRIKNAEVMFLKARIDQQELDHHIEETENEIARLQVQLSEESQIKEMMDLSIKMFTELGSEWDEAFNEDKQGFAQSLFSEVIFDLDTHPRFQTETLGGTISSGTSK